MIRMQVVENNHISIPTTSAALPHPSIPCNLSKYPKYLIRHQRTISLHVRTRVRHVALRQIQYVQHVALDKIDENEVDGVRVGYVGRRGGLDVVWGIEEGEGRVKDVVAYAGTVLDIYVGNMTQTVSLISTP